MRLNLELLKDRAALRALGYALPAYDVRAMREQTEKTPEWVHFGPGNIFRAHIARAAQALLNEGWMKTGILAFAAADSETVGKVYTPFDDLCLSVLLCADGRMEKEIVASVARAAICAGDGMEALLRAFRAPSLQLATLTITEKGYSPAAYEGDLARAPEEARSLIGVIARSLCARMLSCGRPMAVVSMDNCSKNGEKLKNAVLSVARAWRDAGHTEAGFPDWIEQNIAFPWTMIDKITPRPDGRVQALLEKDGFEGIAPVVTARGTHAAPFVNAEEKEYLVVEDDFPNGRPPLERAGLFFAPRTTVSAVERMKVTVCLNPLHTAMAIFGCLMGYDAIWKETKDEDIARLIHRIGAVEGLPVAPNPGVFSPQQFLNEVVNDRLPNPFLPDTPQRIATDTSQKLSIRFGETIKAHLEKGDADALVGIPLALAGYLRYLLAVDDRGETMRLSDDPRLPELQNALKGVRFGDPDVPDRALQSLLRDEKLFGLNLEQAGLADTVCGYFRAMNAGVGAVRATLRRALCS